MALLAHARSPVYQDPVTKDDIFPHVPDVVESNGMSREEVTWIAASVLDHAGFTLSLKLDFSQRFFIQYVSLGCPSGVSEMGAMFVLQGEAAMHIHVAVDVDPVLSCGGALVIASFSRDS